MGRALAVACDAQMRRSEPSMSLPLLFSSAPSHCCNIAMISPSETRDGSRFLRTSSALPLIGLGGVKERMGLLLSISEPGIGALKCGEQLRAVYRKKTGPQ
ncbi:hypothetical protein [Methylocystis hirsuta]|uniref:hypothetical protein n=1 Tax=Methylocystis hirsuta TaxID=369798 RepID=UPI0011CE5FEA|nr:hypothetical protein [Methylocystis hirsuta]